MNYWLLKSEGACYSIDDLKKDKNTAWSGVRNYQARNFMRDHMKVGDLCLFYHSNGTKTSPTGVVGVALVSSKAHPDNTALDPKDEHYDPKSTKENPIWECVDISYVSHLKNIVTLQEIKIDPALMGIMVTEKGSRLSIQPVSKKHFEYIVQNLGKTNIKTI
jgi:predicted RNA-binding protein with PUA-like domain